MNESNCKSFRDKWIKTIGKVYIQMGKGIFKRPKNE